MQHLSWHNSDAEPTIEEVWMAPADAVAEDRARKKRRVGSSGPTILAQVVSAQAGTLVKVKKEKTALEGEVEDQEQVMEGQARIIQKAKTEKAELARKAAAEGSRADRLEDRIQCIICMEQDRAVMFLPCAHLTCCQGCSEQLSECPICRANIEKRHIVRIA